MQADSGPALGDQFIFTSGSYPKLKYGESSGLSDVDCGGSTKLSHQKINFVTSVLAV